MSIIVTSWQSVHLQVNHDYEMGPLVEQYSAVGFEVKSLGATYGPNISDQKWNILMQRPISWADASISVTYPVGCHPDSHGPIAELKAGMFWDWNDVRQWLVATGRLDGGTVVNPTPQFVYKYSTANFRRVSVLEAIGVVLLNIVVGGAILAFFGTLMWVALNNLVGEVLDLRQQIPLLVSAIVANGLLIWSWGPADDGGFKQVLAVVAGLIAAVTTIPLLWRLAIAYFRQDQIRRDRYQAWYRSLTPEQQLLEEIRRNTAIQAREAERLRHIAEDKRRLSDT